MAGLLLFGVLLRWSVKGWLALAGRCLYHVLGYDEHVLLHHRRPRTATRVPISRVASSVAERLNGMLALYSMLLEKVDCSFVDFVVALLLWRLCSSVLSAGHLG